MKNTKKAVKTAYVNKNFLDLLPPEGVERFFDQVREDFDQIKEVWSLSQVPEEVTEGVFGFQL